MNKISIIVPVYNVEQYLEKCVNSLLNQKYKDYNIILVDDGSTDNSSKICDEYSKKFNNIKTYHKINGGLSDARNFGIEHSDSEYLMFIDSDDWIEEDTLELLAKELNDNYDIICFGMIRDYENGVKITKKSSNRLVLSNVEAITKLNTFQNIDISACNKIYRRKLFDNIKFPTKKLCEDYYVMYKLFYYSNKILVLPDAKYHYFQRIGSITKNNNINYDFIYASKEQMCFLSKINDELDNVGKVAYAFSNITIYNTCLIKNVTKKLEELSDEAKKYKKNVYKEKGLPLIKKIEFWMFVNFRFIYNSIIKIKYRRRYR